MQSINFLTRAYLLFDRQRTNSASYNIFLGVSAIIRLWGQICNAIRR